MSLSRRTVEAGPPPSKIKGVAVQFFSALVTGMDMAAADAVADPMHKVRLRTALLSTHASPSFPPRLFAAASAVFYVVSAVPKRTHCRCFRNFPPLRRV